MDRKIGQCKRHLGLLVSFGRLGCCGRRHGEPIINGLVRRGNRFGGGKSGGVLVPRAQCDWRQARRNEMRELRNGPRATDFGQRAGL